MSKLCNITQLVKDTEINISKYRTPEFIKTTKTVSKYIKNLPLSKEQNDLLVKLLVDNVTAAERSGFYSAFAYLTGSGGVSN